MYAYVGSFTTPARRASGLGLGVYRTAAPGQPWSLIQQITALTNPSFLVANRSGTILYATHGDETYVTVFAIDRETGRLTSLGQCETGGKNGVKLVIDASERYAIVANYGTGDVSVLSIAASGLLSSPVATIALPGAPRRWPRASRQDSSHPHDLVFDPSGRFLLVPDLGLDRVFVLEFRPGDGSLTLIDSPHHTARAGAGPRHIALHGEKPHVWVLNELDSTVSLFRFDAAGGGLFQTDVVSALPGDCNVDNTAGEIVYDPHRENLYASNRGHDSIAVFRVDGNSGRLTSRGWFSTEGSGPRFFGFGPDQEHLYVANEKSGDVQTFKIDPLSGMPTYLGVALRTPSPTWIAFVP